MKEMSSRKRNQKYFLCPTTKIYTQLSKSHVNGQNTLVEIEVKTLQIDLLSVNVYLLTR